MKVARLYPWLIGAALMAVGITVIVGWLTYDAELVRVRPTLIGMVMNTALCLCTVGLVFFLSGFPSRGSRRVTQAIAIALIVFATLVLSQYLLNVDFRLDWRVQHLWLDDTHPVPGRMAVGACVGVILCGTSLLLMRLPPTRAAAICMHLSVLGVLLIGVTGLMGQSLRVDLIYSALRWPSMSVQESGAMMLIAVGLWMLRYRMPQHQRYRFREDEKIGFIGAAILTVISLTIGVGGLSVQVNTLQQNLTDKLLPMLENRYTLVHSSITHSEERAENIAHYTSIAHVLARYSTGGDNAALVELRDTARRILRAGFSGVSIVDVHKREVVRAGDFATAPQVQAYIDSLLSTMIWNDGYYLRTHLTLQSNDKWVGDLIVEQPLLELTGAFFNVDHIGITGELGICVDDGLPDLSCFPQSRNRAPYGAPRFGLDGKLTAMSRAVAGKEGVFEGQDYRGHIIVAAFKPLAPGLGLAVKQDTAELFAPIRRELTWALPLLVLFIGMGAFALGSLVTPIAGRLLQSEKAAKEREQHTRAVLDNIAEGIITLDEDGVIESFGGSAQAIFGYSPEELIGRSIENLRPASTRTGQTESVLGYLHEAVRRTTSQLMGQHKDGTVFPVEFSINEVRLDERNLFVVIARDITERKRTEEALYAEKERLHVTLSSIGDAVITTDTAGRVTYLNPVAEEMTGWNNSEASGLNLSDVFHVVDESSGESVQNPVELVIQRDMPMERQDNTVLVRADGMRFAIEDIAAPIRNYKGKVLGVVLVFRDVTQARKMAVQLTYQATHDGLTGLINRSEFERRLQYLLDAGRAENRQHTLLYLDLDRFKIVNDTCGHVAGDELLRQLSNLLQAPLRQSDTIARLGGDEFCVLLDCCAAAPALGVAEALRRIVSDFRFVWDDKTFPIGMSIGLVTFNEGDTTVADIFHMADAACYVAKDKGRNRIQAYSPDDDVLAQRHGEVGWLERIRKALDEDRFVLYAQKIMALQPSEQGKCHFELLLRMMEDGKIVPPMAFIPAAERYGLMPALDRWVIRTAFAHHAERVGKGEVPCSYAINLSGCSLGDERFLDYVLMQFDKYDVPPQLVCFEITETSAIANLSHAVALIQKLKAIGCRFSLDDFGSGMSSFAYLKHLPVDYLKIDGSFVKDMVDDPIDFAMVESINNIGHVMGIQTIAEFVENDAILAALRRVGVDFAQGYGIAKPVPLAMAIMEPVIDNRIG